MITSADVYNADPNQLTDIELRLIVEKMKLDKFFSIFLDNNDFDESDTTTDEWVTYREMMKEYGRVDHLLTAVRYRISHV